METPVPSLHSAIPSVTENCPPSTSWPTLASDYKPPFMRWFEGDFWADRNVIRMTPQQRHFYRALLQAAFQCDTRPYLPDDDAQLWILADAPSLEAWEENREAVTSKFAPSTDGKGRKVLGNKRLLEEWQVATTKHQTARESGIRGRNKQLSGNSESRATPGPPPGVAQQNQNQSQNQSQNQNAESKTEKPSSSPSGDGVPVGFDAFWKVYPKKIGKRAAAKAWSKINPNGVLQQKILTAIEAQKETDQWAKDGGQYIPHPLTWLNQMRWEDEPKVQGTREKIDPKTFTWPQYDSG